MLCQNMSAASGESPATDASTVHHSLMNLWIIIYLLGYSMCLVILIHTYMVLHQQKMMLCHKELQIWESREQIRRNSQRSEQHSYHCKHINMSFPTPNPAPVSLSAYDIQAFNGHTCLTKIHQLLTDFAHMQSHVCLAAASHLPPGMLFANEHEWKMICLLIKEEWKHLTTIKQIVDLIDTNDAEIEELYDESRLIHNGSWGTLAWGPPPPWAVTEQQPLPIAAPNPPPADEADGFQD